MAALAGRIEVNLCRLLSRCEAMASDSDGSEWRLEKYIGALYDYLAQLRKLSANAPSSEVLGNYTRRVELLRGIAEAKKLSTASERSQAVDLLIPSSHVISSNAGSRDLHAQTKARYHNEMRDELLGRKDTKLRHRGSTSDAAGESLSIGDDRDVDALIRHHNEMQEHIAEEMLHMARNLKETAAAAGSIVREDTKKISEASHLVETNYGKLKVESDRLETHVKRACSSWIFIMLVLVILTFIWMVVFMKMFPKK